MTLFLFFLSDKLIKMDKNYKTFKKEKIGQTFETDGVRSWFLATTSPARPRGLLASVHDVVMFVSNYPEKAICFVTHVYTDFFAALCMGRIFQGHGQHKNDDIYATQKKRCIPQCMNHKESRDNES